ncbi:hypothetical protein VF10_38290 [Nostoc linckia z13]|uniref:hypothetical protein n=1 Tax=Nostoc linckia TaxID=92942 RepID=UPI000BFF90A4|nr:hypothetical protein VF10_38290 [Nostoc linckia z13]
MKYQILLLFICVVATKVTAQSLPQISYKVYGFKKQVKQAEQFYYGFDGDSVEKVEKVTRRFNPDGNLESYENQSFLDDSWAKSKSAYKNGRLHQEVWQHSNPYLNRTYTYQYDKENRIKTEKIRFKDGAKSYINFQYQNNQLHFIEAEIDGIKSTTAKYYSQKGNLYKEIHRQKVEGEDDIITNYFYLEDKEILSFVAPKSYFYSTAYLSDQVEIKFKLVEDTVAQNKLYKGILYFDQEAPKDQLPFDLQAYSGQTLQAYLKNQKELKPYRILLFYRNELGDILAEAEVDVKTKTVSGIGFSKITYSDGRIAGTTDFDEKINQHFVEMLKELDLP